MTASVKRPMLNPSKQIPVQLLLSNATSDHFFDYQMKDTLSQTTTTTKLYPVKKCKKNIRNNAKKIEVSLIIFTLLLIYNAKFV